MHSPSGSAWRRWDLHLHPPGTKLANGYGEASDEILAKFVRILEESEVQAFGITDYFSFDSYLQVKRAYAKHFPASNKLLVPNIEFRLTETVSSEGSNVHSHVLFDPEVATEERLTRLLNDVRTHITSGGNRIRCSDLADAGDFRKATVSVVDLVRGLQEIFANSDSYMLVTAANNDGLRGVDAGSARSASISDELDKVSHGFFGSSVNSDYFLRADRYEDAGSLSEAKPVFLRIGCSLL